MFESHLHKYNPATMWMNLGKLPIKALHLILLSVALSFCTFVAIALINGDASSSDMRHIDNASTTRVQTFPAKRLLRIEVERVLVGITKHQKISHLAFGVSGHVVNTLVTDGNFVKKGSVIALLDDTEIAARILGLEAEAKSYEATMHFMQEDLVRVSQLFEAGATSLRSKEEKILNLAEATARRDISISKLSIQMENSRRTRLIAPYDSIILELRVFPGTYVNKNDILVTLVPDTQPFVETNVISSPFGVDDVGKQVSIEIEGQAVRGYLRQVIPTASGMASSYRLIFEITDSRYRLPPNKVARIHYIKSINSTVFRLPLEAVLRSSQNVPGWYCYVAQEERQLIQGREIQQHVVEKRYVTVEEIDKSSVYVTGLLTEGDLVIAGGLHRVVPGERVIVQRNTPAAVPVAKDLR